MTYYFKCEDEINGVEVGPVYDENENVIAGGNWIDKEVLYKLASINGAEIVEI